MFSHATGILLCGGQSSRMKQDKGLMVISSGQTWAEGGLRKLKSVCQNTALSIRKEQHSNYKILFHNEKFIFDQKLAAGPMRALLSSYLELKTSLFVLAVDMINMTPEVMNILLQRASDKKHKDIVLFQNKKRMEVLCGFYSKRVLHDLYSRTINQLQKNFSLQKLYKLYDSEIIAVEPEMEYYFGNMNKQIDLLE